MTTMRRVAPFAVLLLGAIVRVGAAQDSQFGITGLGTPGRAETVRSRTTGGAFAAFDALSAVAEAALVDIQALSSSVTASGSFRNVETPTNNTWLRTTRFPLFSLDGPVAHNVFVGGGFSSYLDRSYGVVTRDSTVLRGVTQAYTDQIVSDGGVSDLRVGAGVRVGRHLSLGVGAHLLPGSTRETATRRYDDSTTYAPVLQSGQVRYEGYGVSGSALIVIAPTFAIVAFGRSDAELKQYLGDTLTGRADLPNSLGGAVRWTPLPNVRFAGSVTWRSWSNTSPTASNTLDWSAGAEIGAEAPLRVGARGGQLPFGPGGVTPSEWGVSVGTGRGFAKGHGFLDVGLERLSRSGSGLHETVWTALVGMTVRP